ncbi:hypothetical protein BDQ17DRAFT_306486 [Cyathus striatus]|nr:hypothetical protein BDQ17DRAFT_306486 [Cyathus striatus]
MSSKNHTKMQATHPFDNPKKSDVTLRTSDKVDFYVYRVILSAASPVFETMFSLPQQVSDGTSSSVVDISENSEVIDPLLRICYPVIDPLITDLTLLQMVLKTALKYDILVASEMLKRTLRSFVKDKPREVYTVACQLSLEEEALLAAQRWREIAPGSDDSDPFGVDARQWEKTIVGGSYIKDMEKISAGDFYRLTQFVRIGVMMSFDAPNT